MPADLLQQDFLFMAYSVGMERETVEERAARLMRQHRLPGELNRERQRNRGCGICGTKPTTTTLRGPRCEKHLAPQPRTGYCAPLRCYCPTPVCQRPA